jgi:exoribonuclease R
MPLAHFVSEAKKNTPILGRKPVSATKSEVAAPPHVQRTETKRQMAEISEAEKTIASVEKQLPAWKQCQYLKSAGSRDLCKQYMSWCAKEKCQKKFMDTDFFDFKRHLKQHKSIK